MATTSYSHHCTTPGEIALEILASLSGLPKGRIKDAMNKGAVWLQRGKQQKRLRRATTELQPGDKLHLHYNADLLALTPPLPQLLADEKQYTVWVKPAGLLAQGTLEGDHCSLLRVAEQQLHREVYLVHRLDREATGLMLIAHTGKAAAALSALFAREDKQPADKQGIEKRYRVEVRGETAESGEIDSPLDGKAALTRFSRIHYDAQKNSSIVAVELVTGRKHQIRRHFAALDHPVLGDPQYGSNNKDARGLQLQAVELRFLCPLTRQPRHYRMPEPD